MKNKGINVSNGTSQLERKSIALSTDYFPIDENSTEDFVNFVQRYAKKLHYIDTNNKVDGDWQQFFSDVDLQDKKFREELISFSRNPNKFIRDYNKADQYSQPHLVLLLIFLDLYRYPQMKFNQLVERHLDFYYRQVLRINSKPAVADKVYVTFKLENNHEQVAIAKGAMLDAGKDDQGKPLSYALDDEIIVNKAEVKSVRALSHNTLNVTKEVEPILLQKTLAYNNARNGITVKYSHISANDKYTIITYHAKETIDFSLLDDALIIYIPHTKQTLANQVVAAWNNLAVEQSTILHNSGFDIEIDGNGLAIVSPSNIYLVEKVEIIGGDNELNAHNFVFEDGQRLFITHSFKSNEMIVQILNTNTIEQGITFELFGHNMVINTPRGQDVEVSNIVLKWSLTHHSLAYQNEDFSYFQISDSGENIIGILANDIYAYNILKPVRQYDANMRENPVITFNGDSQVLPAIRESLLNTNHASNNLGAIGFVNNELFVFYNSVFTNAELINLWQRQNFNISYQYDGVSVVETPASSLILIDEQVDYYHYQISIDGLLVDYVSKTKLVNDPTVEIINAAFFNELADTAIDDITDIHDAQDVNFIVFPEKLIVLLPAGIEVKKSHLVKRWSSSKYNIHTSESTRLRNKFYYQKDEQWSFVSRLITNVNGLSVSYFAEDINQGAYFSMVNSPALESGIQFNVNDNHLTVVSPHHQIATPYMIAKAWHDQYPNNKKYMLEASGNEEYMETVPKYESLTIASMDKDSSEAFSENEIAIFSDKQTNNNSALLGNGFAFSSSLLQLKEGNREVEIVVKFKSDSFDKAKIDDIIPQGLPESVLQNTVGNDALFSAVITGKNNWLKPDEMLVSYYLENSIACGFKFTLMFNSKNKAITRLEKDDDILAANSTDPMVKVLLNNFIASYKAMKDLLLDKISLTVNVKGIYSLKLANDNKVYNNNHNIQPFTSQPIIGSKLYIANDEICQKPLKNLKLNIEWRGLPKNLATHYVNYTSYSSGHNASLEFHYGKSSLLFSAHDLFENLADGTELNSTTVMNYNDLTLPDSGELLSSPGNPKQWDNYFVLRLHEHDFQHANYANELSRIAYENAKAEHDGSGAAPKIINPPYTPLISEITLDYSASVDINIVAKQQSKHNLMQLHPFGYKTISDPMDDKELRFLPYYNNDSHLYIGVTNIKPNQVLSLLFDVYSNSEQVISAITKIAWSYLADNQWKTFKSHQILFDSTRNLSDKGMVRFSLPADISDENTIMPSATYWLRASLSEKSTEEIYLKNVYSQAALATFINNNNSELHLAQSLAEKSIGKLKNRVAGVKEILQPLKSFSGHAAEDFVAYKTRTSERLRHKQRALTTWDYERLLLEQFPQLDKVKCIANYMNANDSNDVTIMVIPDVNKQNYQSSLTPKVSTSLLHEIKDYIDKIAPLGAKVAVKNPRYQALHYSAGVVFHSGYERGYYTKKLNQALVEYLSPWSKRRADANFFRGIYNTEIVGFLESLAFVDYITDLTLIQEMHEIDNKGNVVAVYNKIQHSGKAEIQFEDTILVSAEQHYIDVVDNDSERMELDFQALGLDPQQEESKIKPNIIGLSIIGVDFLIG